MAGDVVGFGEEDGDAAGFVGMAEVAEGDAVGGSVGIAGDHVGLKKRGSDGVSGDAFFSEQRGVGVSEADEAGFGGGVVRADDAAGLRGHGREIDDATPAAFAHGGKDALGDEERGTEIDAEDVLPIFEGDFGDGLGLGDAGVVDEDLDFAEFPFGLRDDAFDVGGDGDVGLDGDSAAAEFLYGGTDGFGCGLLGVIVDGNVAAGVGERNGD